MKPKEQPGNSLARWPRQVWLLGLLWTGCKEVQPNPHLKVPDRDVVTTSGLSLTLMNPAYMARMVNDSAEAAGGSRGHITGLKPLRESDERRKIAEAVHAERQRFNNVLDILKAALSEHLARTCTRVEG